MPLVSVILPAYNAEKYVKTAIDSILNQTLTDFELIIINDASTDNSLAIISGFSDPRIIVVNNEKNLKVVKSLNKGLKLARGEFIARMDADDIALPQRFEKQVNFLFANRQIDVCCSYVQSFGDSNFIQKPPKFHKDIKAALLFLNVIVHPSVIIRKAALFKHNFLYDEAFTNAEDYALWISMIDKLTFATIPDILLKYRIHDENVSVQKAHNRSLLEAMNFEVYKTLFKRMGANYNSDDLKLHIKLGFRDMPRVSHKELLKYLNWLNILVVANKRSKYFDEDSFRKVIWSNVLFLSKNMKKSVSSILTVFKSIFELVSVRDLKLFYKR